MTQEIDQLPKVAIRSVSERLNQECFCITLDRDALCQALEKEVGDPDFCATFIKTRPHLFSNAPLFISESETSEMLRLVRAVEAATRLPGYQEAALSTHCALANSAEVAMSAVLPDLTAAPNCVYLRKAHARADWE